MTLRRWRQRIGAVRRLGWADRALIAEATVTLAVARMLVIAMPLHRAARLVLRSVGTTGDSAAVARTVAVLPRAARALPFRAQCLEQALAGAMMLRRRHVRATLHLGTLRSEAGFEAHAWLSVGDRVVIGGPVDRYVERARF